MHRLREHGGTPVAGQALNASHMHAAHLGLHRRHPDGLGRAVARVEDMGDDRGRDGGLDGALCEGVIALRTYTYKVAEIVQSDRTHVGH